MAEQLRDGEGNRGTDLYEDETISIDVVYVDKSAVTYIYRVGCGVNLVKMQIIGNRSNLRVEAYVTGRMAN